MTLVKPQTDVSTSVRVASGTRTDDDTDTPVRLSTKATLATQDDLPCSDGEPLESERHRLNMELLINSLQPWLHRRYRETSEGGYVSGDMFLYFSLEQVKDRHFRGPDVMVVLGVEPGERKSWVTWDEGKGPDLVIELLSDTTQRIDKKVKPRVYRDEVGVREYYWFDPFHPEDFAGFAFSSDERASPGSDDRPDAHRDLQPNLAPDDDGRITSDVLGLRLGPWEGCHVGVHATWLRWYTLEGELLLTEEAKRADEEAKRADGEAKRADGEAKRADGEAKRADGEAERADGEAKRADEEAKRADEEAKRADGEAKRADKLADKLRELGLDPDQVR